MAAKSLKNKKNPKAQINLTSSLLIPGSGERSSFHPTLKTDNSINSSPGLKINTIKSSSLQDSPNLMIPSLMIFGLFETYQTSIPKPTSMKFMAAKAKLYQPKAKLLSSTDTQLESSILRHFFSEVNQNPKKANSKSIVYA